jgi:hypothetical protein
MQQPSTASQTQHPAVQMTASLASAPVAALITLLLFVGWGAAGSVHAQSPLPASVATPTSDAASDTVSTPSATPRSPLRRPVGRDAAESVETGPATGPRTGLENVPSVLRPTVRAGGQEQPSTPPLPPPPDVDDPNLIERFRSARYRVLAHRGLGSDGRQAAVLAPVRLPAASDTLRPDPAPSSSPSPPASFPIDEVHALRRLERGWFREKFAETDWSFLGSGRYFTFFDTTRTQDLRARLQAQFGAPTQVMADFDLRRSRPSAQPPPDNGQFEYWFVVNDSIPVKVMDAGGPRDRGIIVAADESVRDRLRRLRRALLAPLRERRRAPFVDYWREPETRRWYRTGYDGTRFFLERIPRYRLEPGRPSLDVSSSSSR